MTATRQWQDKYGSYQLVAHQNFIESKVVGTIGEDITARFIKDITALALSFSGRPFGYLADLTGSEGYTEDGYQNIAQAYANCMELGCVIDAMMIESPLVKSQMQQINDDADIIMPLEIRIFKERNQAVAFLEKMVKKAANL